MSTALKLLLGCLAVTLIGIVEGCIFRRREAKRNAVIEGLMECDEPVVWNTTAQIRDDLTEFEGWADQAERRHVA